MAKSTKKTIKSTVELRNLLKHGDIKTIAEATGYSYVYVYQVIHDVRKNSKIIDAGMLLVKERGRLVKEIQKAS